ncbi:MAG: hypothetical protein RQ761_12010 [Bacteroidales bacterium]|nr:hypothetical protein [Bacteroidales bacterium]
MNIDDISTFLPKFLTPEAQKDLYEGISQFPDNIDQRLYTTALEDTKIVYQGDGFQDLLLVDFSSQSFRNGPGILLSNSCDLYPDNNRIFPTNMIYAPILSLEKFEHALMKESEKGEGSVKDYISAIKKQRISHLFYLPKMEQKIPESFVPFDRIQNSPNELVSNDKFNKPRIFTLGSYGIYLFVVKLSIHFSRINDKVIRNPI